MDRQLYRDHHALDESHWWFLGRRELVRELLANHGPAPNGRLLDVGSGGGAMLNLLLPYGRVAALESDPASVEVIRQRYGERVLVREGSLESTALDSNYELVTLFDV